MKIKTMMTMMTGICLCATSMLFAADSAWILDGDTQWTNTAAWSAGVPGAGDVAYFTNAYVDTKITASLNNDQNIVVGGIELNATRTQLPSTGTNITLDASGSVPIINVNSNRIDLQVVLEGTEGFYGYGTSTNREYFIPPNIYEYGEQILGTIMIGANAKPISGTITYTNVLVINNHTHTHMNADLVVGENAVLNSQKVEFNAKTITCKDVGGSRYNGGYFNAYSGVAVGDSLPIKAESITVESGGAVGSGLYLPNPGQGVSFDLLSPSITVNSGGKIKINSAMTTTVGGSNIVVNSGGEVGFFGNLATYTISNPLVLEGDGTGLGALTVQATSHLTNNSPITLTGSTRIGMWGGGDVSMIMNGVISGTGPLNILSQGGHHTHIRRYELHAANDYTGDTVIQGYACQNITTLHGNNRLPNTILSLDVTDWVQDTTNVFDLNGYDQDLQQLSVNAGAGLDEIKIIGGGGTINASGSGGYGALLNGNALSLHGVTFDAGGSIIALRSNIELTVTGSTVRTTGPSGYILMNHGPLNSTLNVGEDGLVDVQLLRMADMTDPANLSPVVNLNAGGTIKTSLIWIDGTNSPTAIFRFNGGTLENHADATYDNNWIWNDHSTVIADGGANISVDRDITIVAPLLHDSTASAVDGGLTKLGTGALTLAEPCTYTGPTVVSVGTLVIQNDISSSSSITVNPGAAIKLEGEAVVGDVTLTDGSSIAPGSSFGTNTANAIVMETGSSYEWEVGGGGNDLVIADSLDVSGATIDINVTVVGDIAASDTNMLFKLNNIVTSDGSTVVNINGVGTDAAALVYVGTDVLITGVVPEPAILGLLAVLGLAFFRRK